MPVSANSSEALKPSSTPVGAGAAVEDAEAEAEAPAVADLDAAGLGAVVGPPTVRWTAVGFTLSWNACSAACALSGASVSLAAANRSPLAQASRNALAPDAASSGLGGSATTVRGLAASLLPESPETRA